eukprot:CAMPEP_0116896666 /NCGR_PEP_ID=MMETSP0467-20121206/5850_1 /TAXON_ID=283647 /ORGANISM="Mesodinium pulex, Strain SPMC105" /LENGTH=93 /DNA_ID=CAMNT_0004567945 /DNA_START=810 /DNA_END=1091 /DNA_ORIENTATION=+
MKTQGERRLNTDTNNSATTHGGPLLGTDELDRADSFRSTRLKTVTVVPMDKMTARDDKMYKSADWHQNCSTENTVFNKKYAKFRQNVITRPNH